MHRKEEAKDKERDIVCRAVSDRAESDRYFRYNPCMCMIFPLSQSVVYGRLETYFLGAMLSTRHIVMIGNLFVSFFPKL